MAKTIVMEHPLIQHKIGFIRRTETGTKDFRQTISEIAMLISRTCRAGSEGDERKTLYHGF